MRKHSIGIIANPQSGRDIRRLVAHASVFDNEEKVNIVERLLATWNTMGLSSVLFMPDSYNIVYRAAERIRNLRVNLKQLDMKPLFTDKDTLMAASLMQGNVDAIVVIGGDGTNRAAIKGLNPKDSTPIVSISTGTNNVFPSMVEATIAALAAWTMTSEIIDQKQVTNQEKFLKSSWDGNEDIALIDIAFTKERFVGSRAVWDPKSISAVFCSRARPENVGFSSLLGFLCPSNQYDPYGSYAILDSSGESILFPMAPGKIERVQVGEYGHFEENKPFTFVLRDGTVALDGEREIEVFRPTDFAIELSCQGPLTVNVPKALELGVEEGLFKN